jgi:DNA gyrase subunit A
VIALIRRSETPETARKGLMETFAMSQIQAQAILEMQLRRLAHLEQQKIIDEYNEVVKTIAYLEDLLANPRKILYLVKQDMGELKEKYGDKRRTLIKKDEVEEFQEEDLIAHQQVVITLSEQGYIKRIPVSTYNKQNRYGRGVIGMGTRDTDMVKHLIVVDTHDNLLLFTTRGKVYRLKCYDIAQDQSRTTKGTAIANLLPIDPKEKITALVKAQDAATGLFLVMSTNKGKVKMTSLDKFANVRSNGLIAMKLSGGGEDLVAACVAEEKEEVIIISQQGMGIRFAVRDLRIASRTSGGVRGIRLDPGDMLISMNTIFKGAHVLTVTENGFGKMCKTDNYPRQTRGGKGVIAHRVND